MEKYIILRGKAFEKASSFDKRVNEMAQRGYKAVAVAGHYGTIVLMEKISQ